MSELPNRPLSRIIRAEHAASWVDGYAFLDRAKLEAADIIARAEEEVARARDEGRAEGRKAGEAEAAELVARTQAAIAGEFSMLEPRIIDLVQAVVKQVLGSFGDGEIVGRAVRHALAGFREDVGVVVSVAPEIVVEVENHLRAAGASGPGFRVVADRHLSGRQCILTTPSTSIDVGIDAQLDAIRKTMAMSEVGAE